MILTTSLPENRAQTQPEMVRRNIPNTTLDEGCNKFARKGGILCTYNEAVDTLATLANSTIHLPMISLLVEQNERV